MSNQPRDVTGGEKVLSGIIPGLGLLNYILGWFSVPIEVFLRRDFGERYYTRANFFAGFFVLIVFRFISSIFGLINPLALISRTEEEPAENWLISVTKWYVIFGILHFLRMWWNDIMGQPMHSFSSGRSWLRFIGKALMRIMNLFLDAVVRLLIRFVPGANESRLSTALPVLRDVDTFTERFVEPFCVFVLAIVCQRAGQTSMFFWLLFSVMALNYMTGARHQAQRSYILDIRDQMIDARILQDAIHGRDSPGSEQMEQFIKETAREAEKTPEIVEVIKKQHPALADAIAAINPNLRQKLQAQNEFREGPNHTAKENA